MAKVKKKSFVLYNDYQQHIDRLTDEQAGKLFKAIFDYVNTGTITILEGQADMAFSFIALQLDRDVEKYEEICRKRSENGRAGGLARAENERLLKEGLEKFNHLQAIATKCNQMQPSASDNDNETETDNETVNVTDTETESETETDNYENDIAAALKNYNVTETAASLQSSPYDFNTNGQYLWSRNPK